MLKYLNFSHPLKYATNAKKKNENLKGLKNLEIRDWDCPHCHTHHDRDWNAAINILNKGLEIVGTTVQ
ncbi:MAG: transposase [Methanobrevibacter sp.]|uniref:zinc ribbon domain-containing protein n=1 Tax=Methanobrevibacter sp. TaxID=66852 RepID=UPI0034E0C0C1|nr:transposase [Methanobrevibacter sp.]MBQ6100486.1 transposase [Methanobrevibacter sp.]